MVQIVKVKSGDSASCSKFNEGVGALFDAAIAVVDKVPRSIEFIEILIV